MRGAAIAVGLVGVALALSGCSGASADAEPVASAASTAAMPAPDAPESEAPTGNAAACEMAAAALNEWLNGSGDFLKVAQGLSSAAQAGDGAVREGIAALAETAASAGSEQAVDEESVDGAMGEFGAVLEFTKAWSAAEGPCLAADSPLPSP